MFERIEREIRCHNCNKLFTKLIFSVDIPPAQDGSTVTTTLSDLFKEVEIKVGVESKCIRCGNMDNKVFVP